MVGTLDFLHSRGRNDMYLTDINVVPGAVNGEGRLIYGAPATSAACVSNTSSCQIARATQTSAFRQIIKATNMNGAFATSLTAQVQKRFSNGVEFNIGYTYGTTRDFLTLGSSIASSNLQNTVLDGTLDGRNRRRSLFDVPHKLTVSGTVALPFNSSVSLFWVGRSGTPYTYIVNGDANGDGISSNDAVYVPRNINDITLVPGSGSTVAADWAKLDNFINQESCLANARGHILRRNTCRNPWVNFVNARLTKAINTIHGQQMSVSVDFFNVLNFIDSNWGLVRETNFFESINLLRLAGYDTRGTLADPTDDRGRYALALPGRQRIVVDNSRWRIQLGAKYTF